MLRRNITPEFVTAILTSLALHVVWLASEAKASMRYPAKPTEVILEAETLVTPPAAAPKAEPLPPPDEENRPVPVARNAPPRAPTTAPVAPPAAQAGKTLTAPETDDSDAPVDFTLVQGMGTSYAGGTTTALGTSTTAVRGPASERPEGAPARAVAPRTEPATLGPDRSRGARPRVADWNCSRLFPTDPGAGDQAIVLIAVTVLSNGTPQAVTVLRDPGHGFGAAARACALGQRFTPALDRAGIPMLATTPPITVRFTR
jgi:protein TonB